MKKVISILLSAAILLGLAACAKPAASTTAAAPASSSAAAATSSAASASSSASASQASDESLQKVLDAKVFVLGLDDTFMPMGWTENGEIVGFDIDVAKEVAKRMGVELKLQTIDWTTKELELNGGNIDCIWNGMSVTDERKESMNLSVSYMENTQAIYVRADSGIKTKADLAGKSVGAQAASGALDAINAEPEVKATFKELLEESTNVMALTEVKNGQLDAMVGDSVFVDYQLAKWGQTADFTKLEESFGDEEYAIGFRKADVSLTDKVNELLREMKEDGTLAKISTEWFGKDMTIVK